MLDFEDVGRGFDGASSSEDSMVRRLAGLRRTTSSSSTWSSSSSTAGKTGGKRGLLINFAMQFGRRRCDDVITTTRRVGWPLYSPVRLGMSSGSAMSTDLASRRSDVSIVFSETNRAVGSPSFQAPMRLVRGLFW